ncbi:SET domain-containing protein [Arthroderma uncinatum]|uniref:SET domain-containing protein n=1 Tax=Arthroderma uncinatum TaxID=74035 RepID=UPI00144ADC0A|nr:SET domain-containing protein [Arthroderma uncinatum]KAF3490762.1 SET domain-containing protein [Arthroderma uncinatum]
MKRQYLPIEALPAWAKLNSVMFHGVEVKRLPTSDEIDKGSAILATSRGEGLESTSDDSDLEPEILIKVPPDLILSLLRVEIHAKSDKCLREVLEATTSFGKKSRGAILIFLLLLITHTSVEKGEHVGISSPWTEYIKFLPAVYELPTFYTLEERELLRGTSLEPALDTKMQSLAREFDRLRDSTFNIPWCQKDWWHPETGQIGFEDWKVVDAMYRSRAMDLPGTGDAMVPCIDMANHAAGDKTLARYETDPEGNAVLQLQWGQRLSEGEEVTITYGDNKGASEMIFSYGFIDQGVSSAQQIFLDLDIPDDDPLKPAKRAVCEDGPGVRISDAGDTQGLRTAWQSDFVWWVCVNEEDGLEFRVLQSNDGGRELRVFWKGKEITGSRQLCDMLAEDPKWDIFQLRAVVVIQERVANQLALLQASNEYVRGWADKVDDSLIRRSVWDTVMKLRALEEKLLTRSNDDLDEKKLELLESKTVQTYLNSHGPGSEIAEDFS